MKRSGPSAALALVGLVVFGAKLEFAPEEGTVLTKSFGVHVEAAVESFHVYVNGEERPEQEPELGFESDFDLRITDEYVVMADGRPSMLRRTYDRIRQTAAFEGRFLGADQNVEIEGRSDLEGETVVFYWDGRVFDFRAVFEDSDADEALLEDLEEDKDLRRFLPQKEVEVGDTWEFRGSEIRQLLAIGKDLKIEFAEAEEQMDDPFARVWDDPVGRIVCEYRGRKQVDGRSVDEVRIRADLTGKSRRTSENETGTVHEEWQVELELEGTLLWDLEGGHFHRLVLTGETSVEMSAATDFTIGEEDFTSEWTMTLAGKMELTASAVRN
ncbi:MAG: hypothetical protein O7B99_14940 [Planctomycetota bacterium]|nr:hypothetical protein [Planctomycetota bacterium]